MKVDLSVFNKGIITEREDVPNSLTKAQDALMYNGALSARGRKTMIGGEGVPPGLVLTSVASSLWQNTGAWMTVVSQAGVGNRLCALLCNMSAGTFDDEWSLMTTVPASGRGHIVNNDAITDQGLRYSGAVKQGYTGVSVTTAVNSDIVTGVATTWTTQIEPGMYLKMDTGADAGQHVKVIAVISNTSLRLEKQMTAATTGTCSIMPYGMIVSSAFTSFTVANGHVSRLWVAGTIEQGVSYPSRVRWSAFPVQSEASGAYFGPNHFSPGAYVDVYPEVGGKITGIVSFDNSLIVLKETAVFAIRGEVDTAGNGLGASVEMISAYVGNRGHESYDVCELGLVFSDNLGVYVYDGEIIRSLTEESIGRIGFESVSGVNNKIICKGSYHGNNEVIYWYDILNQSWWTESASSQLGYSRVLPIGVGVTVNNVDGQSILWTNSYGGQNEVQSIQAIGGTATGGYMLAKFNGSAFSVQIPWDSGIEFVEQSLQNLSTIGAGNIQVTGGPTINEGYVLTYTGSLNSLDQPTMVVESHLIGGAIAPINVTTIQDGSPPIDEVVTLQGVETAYTRKQKVQWTNVTTGEVIEDIYAGHNLNGSWLLKNITQDGEIVGDLIEYTGEFGYGNVPDGYIDALIPDKRNYSDDVNSWDTRNPQVTYDEHVDGIYYQDLVVEIVDPITITNQAPFGAVYLDTVSYVMADVEDTDDIEFTRVTVNNLSDTTITFDNFVTSYDPINVTASYSDTIATLQARIDATIGPGRYEVVSKDDTSDAFNNVFRIKNAKRTMYPADFVIKKGTKVQIPQTLLAYYSRHEIAAQPDLDPSSLIGGELIFVLPRSPYFPTQMKEYTVPYDQIHIEPIEIDPAKGIEDALNAQSEGYTFQVFGNIIEGMAINIAVALPGSDPPAPISFYSNGFNNWIPGYIQGSGKDPNANVPANIFGLSTNAYMRGNNLVRGYEVNIEVVDEYTNEHELYEYKALYTGDSTSITEWVFGFDKDDDNVLDLDITLTEFKAHIAAHHSGVLVEKLTHGEGLDTGFTIYQIGKGEVVLSPIDYNKAGGPKNINFVKDQWSVPNEDLSGTWDLILDGVTIADISPTVTKDQLEDLICSAMGYAPEDVFIGGGTGDQALGYSQAIFQTASPTFEIVSRLQLTASPVYLEANLAQSGPSGKRFDIYSDASNFYQTSGTWDLIINGTTIPGISSQIGKNALRNLICATMGYPTSNVIVQPNPSSDLALSGGTSIYFLSPPTPPVTLEVVSNITGTPVNITFSTSIVYDTPAFADFDIEFNRGNFDLPDGYDQVTGQYTIKVLGNESSPLTLDSPEIDILTAVKGIEGVGNNIVITDFYVAPDSRTYSYTLSFRGPLSSLADGSVEIESNMTYEKFFAYIGDSARNEIQHFQIDGTPVSGYYIMNILGGETANIPYDATASDIEAAVEFLEGVEDVDISISGDSLMTGYTVYYTGTFAEINLGPFSIESHVIAQGNISASVTSLQGGDASHYNKELIQPYIQTQRIPLTGSMFDTARPYLLIADIDSMSGDDYGYVNISYSPGQYNERFDIYNKGSDVNAKRRTQVRRNIIGQAQGAVSGKITITGSAGLEAWSLISMSIITEESEKKL